MMIRQAGKIWNDALLHGSLVLLADRSLCRIRHKLGSKGKRPLIVEITVPGVVLFCCTRSSSVMLTSTMHVIF